MDKMLLFDHIRPRELTAHFGVQPASQENQVREPSANASPCGLAFAEGGVEGPHRVISEIWKEIVVMQSQHVEDNIPVHTRCGVQLGYIEATTRISSSREA